MSGRSASIWRVPLVALAWVVGASLIGLGVNAAHPRGIPLVAPFSYAHDCREKIVIDKARVEADLALRAAAEKSAAVVFVDVRPAEAFAARHHKGARSIPYSFITPFSAADAAPLRSFEHIFVYCDSPGDRLAGLQAALMRKAGLQQVRIVIGGLAALSAKGEPAPKGAAR